MSARRAAQKLSIRIDLASGRLGPGKVELLEQIAAQGSLAAAARAIGMSYKRAWQLLNEMNRMFAQPVALTQPGRSRGGGTEVTVFGARLIAVYRTIERRATQSAAAALDELNAAARPAARRQPPRKRV